MLTGITIENEDTGGGFIATLITLADGRVLVASTIDPSCGLYASREAWDTNQPAVREYAHLATAVEELS